MVLTVKGLKYHIEFAARMNSLFSFNPLSLGGMLEFNYIEIGEVCS